VAFLSSSAAYSADRSIDSLIDLMTDPTTVYLEMRGELQKVLALPLMGKTEQFREFLVGYLMVECDYSETKARRLVTGNEEAILAMFVESDEPGCM